MLAYRSLLTRSYRDALLNMVGLVGYWRLGELTGTVARDEMGKANGTYVGTPTLGVAGALKGDPNTGFQAASGKRVSGTATGFPSGAAARTVGIWIKGTDTSQRQTIFEYGSDSTGNKFALEWLTLGAGFYLTGYGADTQSNNGSAMMDGNWHFLTATYDGTTVSLYQDGALLISAAKSLNTTFTLTVFEIGSWSVQGLICNAKLAEAFIASRALPLAEISSLARIGRGF